MAKINPTAVVSGVSFRLLDLLSKNQYVIPDYQRDFVWKRNQVLQLWNDLEAHYGRNTKSEEIVMAPGAYFLGAMVVLEAEDGSPSEVVDGQQRLTTFCCIASVLLTKVEALSDDSMKEGLKQNLMSMIATYAGGEWKAKVGFTDEKLERFLICSCIEHRTTPDREKYWENDAEAKELLKRKNATPARIREAIRCTHEEVERFLGEIDDDGQRLQRIASLIQLYTECFVVLKIRASSHSTAYDLFESLNYRGMPLAQADLIKNELIKAAPSQDMRDAVVENWLLVKDSLSSHEVLNLPDFLHYCYMGRVRHIKANKLFDSVKQELITTDAQSYSDRLVADAGVLEKLVTVNDEWSDTTNSMLRDMRRVLNVRLAYVALIAGCEVLGDDKNLFEVFVRLISNFTFRYMKVLEGDVGQLAQIMSNTVELLRKQEPLTVIASTLAKHASDKQFAAGFRNVGFTNTKLSYYVVYCIEKVRLSGVEPVPHGDEQHLEHIMPRTPTVQNWPDAVELKQADSERFREYLWRVGNLLPLPADINTSIKNKSIAYKISNETNKDYHQPNLVSPKEVEKYLVNNEWTLESIENRQKDLASHAVVAWSLDVGG